MNIQSLFEYSALSNLAYVNWTNINDLREIVDDANKAKRVPGKLEGDLDTLGEKIFQPTTKGGLGDNELIGGAGADTLNGGAGNNTYEFNGAFGSCVSANYPYFYKEAA